MLPAQQTETFFFKYVQVSNEQAEINNFKKNTEKFLEFLLKKVNARTDAT